jgi:hypothetical protein
MKAIVEKTPVRLNDDSMDENMLSMFMSILEVISTSKSESELRNYFQNWDSHYFRVGFGSNHFWVTQKVILGDIFFPIERNIIVEF